MLRKRMTYEAARRRAENWCSRADHSCWAFQQKAREWGLSSRERNQLEAELMELGFLNDERFAHAYVRSKFRYSQWGRVKIQQGLYQHHLNPALIEEALAAHVPEDDYQAMVRQLTQKKAGQLGPPPTGYPERKAHETKLLRFLAQRGIEAELAYAALAHAWPSDT